VYLVDVVGFILDHSDDPQTALQVVGGLMIPKGFAQVHFLLVPLSLFSRAVAERWRLLADIFPISIEVLCKWKRIHHFFVIPDGWSVACV
jgi:5,10-methenyltetrahydromethanopterin hydrogenase